MKRVRLVVFAAVAFSAVAAFAGGLTKYKGWDNTPEAYFMTADDRSDWRKVRTDDDAEKFVTAFEARRGEQFRTDVAQATAAADKYFTVARTKGSVTERGKLIIILGPPGGVTLAKKKVAGDSRANPNMQIGSASPGGGGGGQGASVADMMGAVTAPGSGSGTVNEYTITYPAASLPASYGKDLVAKIEVNNDGTDFVADRKTQGELDRLYEMVAQAKATAPATPAASH